MEEEESGEFWSGHLKSVLSLFLAKIKKCNAMCNNTVLLGREIRAKKLNERI